MHRARGGRSSGNLVVRVDGGCEGCASMLPDASPCQAITIQITRRIYAWEGRGKGSREHNALTRTV